MPLSMYPLSSGDSDTVQNITSPEDGRKARSKMHHTGTRGTEETVTGRKAKHEMQCQ